MIVFSRPVYSAGYGHSITIWSKEGSMGCAVVLGHLRVAPIEARIFNSDCVIYIFPCFSCQLVSEESRNNLELVSIVINLSFFKEQT